MAGIYDVYQIPEVRKDNPLQTHFDQNQLLKEAVKAGKITPEQYNVLGGYDVQKNLTPGNPILGGIVNLAASVPYNIYQSIESGQPISDIPGDVYRNVKGGLGLFPSELKTAYNDIMAGKVPQDATQLANLNLSNTLSNLAFTPAYGDIPTKEERQGIESFNNLVSDTVMAEPQKGFEDYPGVENLGGVQNFDLKGVQDIISQMEEEKGNYIERPEDRFSMDGILQNLGNYAKDAAGRYIGSQALGGAGAMLLGPIGGLVGGIAGLLGGGNLFNQNTYSQQMYNNLTSGGKQYADQLYGPGGILQGYNQFSAFGRGTLGTIGNILSKNPNMSMARQGAFRKAADDYISGIDPTQQGINAVTKRGGYGYDDAVINYAPPSGGDSGGSSSGETYGSVGSYEDFGSTY